MIEFLYWFIDFLEDIITLTDLLYLFWLRLVDLGLPTHSLNVAAFKLSTSGGYLGFAGLDCLNQKTQKGVEEAQLLVLNISH
jgi:hypothetical protein